MREKITRHRNKREKTGRWMKSEGGMRTLTKGHRLTAPQAMHKHETLPLQQLYAKRGKGGARRRPREHVGCDVLLSFLEVTCKPHTKICGQHDHLLSSPRGYVSSGQKASRKNTHQSMWKKSLGVCVLARSRGGSTLLSLLGGGSISKFCSRPRGPSDLNRQCFSFFFVLLVAECYGPRACISSDDI